MLRKMLENAVKHSEFVYTREQCYTKVIYYYYYYFYRSSGFQVRSKDQEILEKGGGAGPSNLPKRGHE